MANDQDNAAVTNPDPACCQPELMVAAVLHLMSHYSAHPSGHGPCVKLASVIERHLYALAHLPELAPVLRATCEQLGEQWTSVVERSMPRPQKPGLLTRMLRGQTAG